eukprot:GHVT01011114.1.p1 GENE.GHVT01011114.1~~GHVT01011114.1.p1  ORF type:complete len:489 (-),score=82.33 GHVT01011114.1:66-1532(-)
MNRPLHSRSSSRSQAWRARQASGCHAPSLEVLGRLQTAPGPGCSEPRATRSKSLLVNSNATAVPGRPAFKREGTGRPPRWPSSRPSTGNAVDLSSWERPPESRTLPTSSTPVPFMELASCLGESDDNSQGETFSTLRFPTGTIDSSLDTRATHQNVAWAVENPFESYARSTVMSSVDNLRAPRRGSPFQAPYPSELDGEVRTESQLLTLEGELIQLKQQHASEVALFKSNAEEATRRATAAERLLEEAKSLHEIQEARLKELSAELSTTSAALQTAEQQATATASSAQLAAETKLQHVEAQLADAAAAAAAAADEARRLLANTKDEKASLETIHSRTCQSLEELRAVHATTERHACILEGMVAARACPLPEGSVELQLQKLQNECTEKTVLLEKATSAKDCADAKANRQQLELHNLKVEMKKTMKSMQDAHAKVEEFAEVKATANALETVNRCANAEERSYSKFHRRLLLANVLNYKLTKPLTNILTS